MQLDVEDDVKVTVSLRRILGVEIRSIKIDGHTHLDIDLHWTFWILFFCVVLASRIVFAMLFGKMGS